MDDRQVTMFYTGAIIRMCDCPGPTPQIYSDGKKEYVRCNYCKQTWELTGEEGKYL